MKINNLFRRFRRDKDTTADVGTEADTATGTGEEANASLTWDTAASAMASKALGGLLLAGVVAGPIALVLALLAGASTPAQRVAAPANTGTVGERAAVSAFAEHYVTTWLSAVDGEEDDLAAYLGKTPEVDLPLKAWKVSDPSTSDLVKTSSGFWSVTVSATIWSPSNARTRRYFTVPVSYSQGSLVAQALPSPVAAPSTGTAEALVYRYPSVSSSAVTEAVSDFLTALLTGSGDLTRFISPSASIRPVTPPAFQGGVRVREVLLDVDLGATDQEPASGATVHALVTATGTSGPNRTTPIQYALTLLARDGRWEIASIDPAPLTPDAASTGSAEPPSN